VLAPGAADERLTPSAARLARFVARGGRVVAFAQTSQARWLPLLLCPLPPGDSPETARAFARPGFDVPDGWLRDWQPLDLIARGTYPVPDQTAVEPLLVSGGPGGLDRSPLLRVTYGSGAYYLCQLDLHAADPARPWVLQKLLELALARPSGDAPAPLVTSYRSGDYRTVALSRYVNAGAPAGFDQGELPPGRLLSGRVRFEILNPADHGGRWCLALTEIRQSGADREEVRSNDLDCPGVSDLPLGGTVDELHLLLACRRSDRYDGWSKDTLLTVKLTYQDGGTASFDLDFNRHVTDWRDPPRDLPCATVGWAGRAAGRPAVCYHTVLHNPDPTRPVKSLTIWQSQAPSKTPAILALTVRDVTPLP